MIRSNQTLAKTRKNWSREGSGPVLRFSPTAWAKLLYLRDLGDTEVGGFAISQASDLLCVTDVQLVRQTCTPASVEFDDESVADFFDNQVDQGLVPEQFGRIWVHTHPGNCPQPSGTDEETFERVFGAAQWAVMFILAQGGQTYARLAFYVGPRGACEIPVDVDFQSPFGGSNEEAWRVEYLANVLLPRRVAMPAADERQHNLEEQPAVWQDAVLDRINRDLFPHDFRALEEMPYGGW